MKQSMQSLEDRTSLSCPNICLYEPVCVEFLRMLVCFVSGSLVSNGGSPKGTRYGTSKQDRSDIF